MTTNTHTLVDYDFSSLCGSCKTLPTAHELLGDEYQLHTSLAELECCPCPFCKWLWRTIEEERRGLQDEYPTHSQNIQEAYLRQMPISLVGMGDTASGYGSWWIHLRLADPQKDRDLCFFRVYTLSDDPCSIHIKTGPYCTDHRAEEAFTRVQEWLGDCISSHPACSPPSDVELPTFTIDVGRPGTKSKLRLLDNSSRTARGQYIALSYVWGVSKEATLPGVQAKTTLGDVYLNTHNREQYVQEVPEEMLPQTIQDAIFVTRKLGVQYLWVDALCIVQDDRAFKKTELLNMHNIYRNSCLTIRTACTKTVFDSFLFKRPHPDIPDQRLAYSGGECEPAYVYLRSAISQSSAPAIAHRAWCYEEEVLPKRVLTYLRIIGMRFECCAGLKDEDGRVRGVSERAGIVRSSNIQTQSENIINGTPSNDHDSDHDRSQGRLKVWYSELDKDYNQRSLSNPSDRLPAIAGVVLEIQPSVGGVYVNGIWKVDLPWGLLWWTRGPRLSASEPTGIGNERSEERLDGRAFEAKTTKSLEQQSGPSWSWATLQNHTLHLFSSRFTEDVVSEIVQFPDRDDYLGDDYALKVLKIKGPVTLAYTGPISDMLHLLKNHPRPGSFANCMLKRHSEAAQPTPGDFKRFAFAKIDILDELGAHSSETICLFVTNRVGMVLKRCDEIENGYRRLGLFKDYQGFYDDGLAVSTISIV